MISLKDLNKILKSAEKEASDMALPSARFSFAPFEYFGSRENLLILGDNAEAAAWLLRESGRRTALDFVYIDPPFFSGVDRNSAIRIPSGCCRDLPPVRCEAYSDADKGGFGEFLRMLAVRLFLIRGILASSGNIVVHLDFRAVHYVKLLMDNIFGAENFVNEIIWQYRSGGASGRSFARKHDTLLYYSKGPDYYFEPQKEKSYNRGRKPYRFKGVEEYEDEGGWYTLVNRRDVMNVDMVGRTAGERTGYATQKPEKLLAALLESCCPPGGLCADFFGGSGTLAAVCAASGRRFISCDISPLATGVARRRLVSAGAKFSCMRRDNSAGHATESPACEGEDLRRPGRSGSQGVAGSKGFEIDCEVSCSEAEAGRRAIEVELAACRPPLASYGLGADSLRTAQEALRRDPLALVAFYSLGCDRGGEFTACSIATRSRGGLPKKLSARFPKGESPILAVYDIFGGRSEVPILNETSPCF